MKKFESSFINTLDKRVKAFINPTKINGHVLGGMT